MSDENEEHLTKEELQQLVESDRQTRIIRASKRIQSILDEEQCRLVAQPQIRDGRIVASIQIIAL